MAWIKTRRLRYGYNFYEEEVLLLQMIRFHLISKQDMKYIVKPKIARVFNREVTNLNFQISFDIKIIPSNLFEFIIILLYLYILLIVVYFFNKRISYLKELLIEIRSSLKRLFKT